VKTELKSYRAEARDKAIAVMEDGGGFLLFNEQRTGKTDIGLAVAEHYHKEANSLVIICPKGAIRVWEEAITKEGLEPLFEEIHIVNYEAVRANHLAWYKWRDKHKGKFIIIADEIHRIKDRGSSQSQRCRTFARGAAYKLGLTGTPLEQSLQDAWPLFNFINPDIFGPFDDKLTKDRKRIVQLGFEGKYLVYGGFQGRKVVGYRNEKEFQKIFHKYSYRITLNEAKRRDGKVPPILHYRKVYCELTKKNQDLYDSVQKELVAVVNKRRVKIKNLLAAVAKLQQITGGFFRETWIEEHRIQKGKKTFIKNVPQHRDYPIGHEKLELLHTRLRSMQAGTKFIIICRHVWEIETIHSFLHRLGYSLQVVRGGLPYSGKVRGDGVIMQIASACAVDMSEADMMFIYSSDYSYIKWEQARFRILSYAKGTGSKYEFLLAKDTVDEVIYDAISNKKALSELIIDRYRHRGSSSGKNRKPDRSSL
jgi:hypothetical protein